MRLRGRHTVHWLEIDGGLKFFPQTSSPPGPRVHPLSVAGQHLLPRPGRLRSLKVRPGLISIEVRLRPHSCRPRPTCPGVAGDVELLKLHRRLPAWCARVLTASDTDAPAAGQATKGHP